MHLASAQLLLTPKLFVSGSVLLFPEDAVHLESAQLLLTPKLFVSGSMLLFPEDEQPTSLYLHDTKTHFLPLANMHVCAHAHTHT